MTDDPQGAQLLRQIFNHAYSEPPTLLEVACDWLRARSYATGHGDTIEDVLAELEWQAMERGAKEARGVCPPQTNHKETP